MRPETCRGDMRHETRDLPGGRETVRQVEIAARPMARPQGRQSLNVSLSHPISMSRCLNVSASLKSQVSGLPHHPCSPSPAGAARAARSRRSATLPNDKGRGIAAAPLVRAIGFRLWLSFSPFRGSGTLAASTLLRAAALLPLQPLSSTNPRSPQQPCRTSWSRPAQA